MADQLTLIEVAKTAGKVIAAAEGTLANVEVEPRATQADALTFPMLLTCRK